MKKVIIDTDPGVDDAIALCYAMAHPQIDVVALTTVFGNVDTPLATKNALALCELNQQNIPVAAGASKPLAIVPNPHSYFVHGDNGFGNIELPTALQPASALSAAELIVKTVMADPKTITLVAVGPLTNLALALELEPAIAQAVETVLIMGGAFERAGNVTPHAEANIWNDPHAADKVLAADWPVVIHGLDITHQIEFDRNVFDRLASGNPPIGGFLHDAAEFYIDFYQQQHQFEGCCPHDLLPLSYLTLPGIFECNAANISVVTDGEEIGRTVTAPATGSKNKLVARKVDADKLINDYLTTLKAD